MTVFSTLTQLCPETLMWQLQPSPDWQLRKMGESR